MNALFVAVLLSWTAPAESPETTLPGHLSVTLVIPRPSELLVQLRRYGDHALPGFGVDLERRFRDWLEDAIGIAGADLDSPLLLGYGNDLSFPADWVVARFRKPLAGDFLDRVASDSVAKLPGPTARYAARWDKFVVVSSSRAALERWFEAGRHEGPDEWLSALAGNSHLTLLIHPSAGTLPALSNRWAGRLLAMRNAGRETLVGRLLHPEFIRGLEQCAVYVRVGEDAVAASLELRPRAESPLSDTFRSLRSARLPEVVAMPTGAQIYFGCAYSPPMDRLFGPWLLMGGATGGIAEEVARELQRQPRAFQLERVVGGFWVNFTSGIENLAIIRVNRPQALVEQLLQAWETVAANRELLRRFSIDRINVEREARRDESIIWHRVVAKWNEEALVRAQLGNRTAAQFLGEAYVTYIGIHNGSVLCATASDDATARELMKAYVARQAELHRATVEANALPNCAFLVAVDTPGLFQSLVEATTGRTVPSPPPAYVRLVVLPRGETLAVQLNVPAAALGPVLWINELARSPGPSELER